MSSRASAVIMLTALVAAAAIFLLPFLLVGQLLAAQPEARAVLAAHPGTGLQLVLALSFLALLFAWPVQRAVSSLAEGRTIHIGKSWVSVTERGLLRTYSWELPLADYAGVVHHVRASLSGIRHELILAHRDAGRSILLEIADKISKSEVDRVAALLGHAEISSRELYSLRKAPEQEVVSGPAQVLARAHA
jgi:hypothetical protein